MKKLLIVVLLAAGGAWYAWNARPPPAPVAASPTLARVGARTIEVAAEAAGLVEPIRVVEVKSKASGEVLRVLVDTGDEVKAGALLAEIEPRDVQNALDQALADISAARVRSQTTAAQLERMRTLRESGVVTQQEYEAAVEAAASAKAAVVRGETNLQLARERRRDVIIRAPGDGTVLTRDVQPGQIIASAMANVSGGTTLFKTADLAEMQVRAKVDETDIGQVQPGQAVQVSVEAYPGRTFMGTVHKIEPQAVVEQNVTMFPVLVRLKNPERLLKPGMTAEVKIQVARRPDVTAVPNTAVVSPREARTAALAVGLDEDAVRAMFRAQADGNASPACVALREKLAAAGGPRGLSDEDREALRACRAASEAASGKPEGRRAVVFVQGANGPEPRRVRLGVSDWEYSEVLEGVSAGEQVVLVSVAQLQKKQQEMTDRFRQRTGGMVPGGGGGGGPRGR